MKKVDIDEIIKQASFRKVTEREDIELYSAGFSDAGYNATMDVEASSVAEARKVVKANLEAGVEGGYFDSLMPKVPKKTKQDK